MLNTHSLDVPPSHPLRGTAGQLWCICNYSQRAVSENETEQFICGRAAWTWQLHCLTQISNLQCLTKCCSNTYTFWVNAPCQSLSKQHYVCLPFQEFHPKWHLGALKYNAEDRCWHSTDLTLCCPNGCYFSSLWHTREMLSLLKSVFIYSWKGDFLDIEIFVWLLITSLPF